MSAFAGKNARITIGGISNLTGTKWSINIKADDLDVTNFESPIFFPAFGATTARAYECVGGIIEADISFDAVFDSVTTPFSSPPALYSGTTVLITLDPDRNNIAITTFAGTMLVVNVMTDASVRGIVTYSVSGKFTGSVTAIPGI